MAKENSLLNKLKSKEPYGPSQIPWNIDPTYDTDATCSICGTNHPQDPKGILVFNLGDVNVVAKCCGKIVDELFSGLGEAFAATFLKNNMSLENPRLSRAAREYSQKWFSALAPIVEKADPKVRTRN